MLLCVSTVICMPTYNERENIELMLRALGPHLGPHDRVVVIDDSSTDGTADLAEHVAAELSYVEVLRRQSKRDFAGSYCDGLGLTVAATISFLLAACSNYTWNRAWTFRAERLGLLSPGARFLAVPLLALAVNLLVLQLLSGAGVTKMAAQATAILCSVPLNFLGNKLWSFRRLTPAPCRSTTDPIIARHVRTSRDRQHPKRHARETTTPSRRKRMKAIHRVLALTAAAAGASAIAAASALAGYGPTPPPGAPVPGGFQNVAASKTVLTGGGDITANTGTAKAVVVVPAAAFNVPLQVTVTAPKLSTLEKALPAKFDAVAGLGVQANLTDGTKVQGHFGNEPITLEIKSSKIKPGDEVLVWSAKAHKFVKAKAEIKNGVATVKTNRYEEFVVVAPHKHKG